MLINLSTKLKGLRENKGMSQVQVSKRLNLDKSTISRYESGDKIPSIETLKQFAYLYGVTVDYLSGYDERETIIVDGLTKSQRQILDDLLMEFKKYK